RREGATQRGAAGVSGDRDRAAATAVARQARGRSLRPRRSGAAAAVAALVRPAAVAVRPGRSPPLRAGVPSHAASEGDAGLRRLSELPVLTARPRHATLEAVCPIRAG